MAGLALLAALALAGPAIAHGVPESEVQRLVEGGPLAYLRSGAVHMVTGYDHLLFLFGVMFFLTRFGQIAKFVTVFTLGHSITLLAATLLGIKANYFLVDAVIAISVIYKGFDNLDGFRKGLGVKPPDLLWMVFGFGLIHGFGLSTRLQKLPLPQEGLVERILAFNVGVELGQLAALVVMVAILVLWRRSSTFPVFSKVANYGLIIAGCLLFLMQMHGWLHTTHPDDLGFSSDLHSHDHSRMDAEQKSRHPDSLMAPEPRP
ncbi:MAG: HupE/UreJ family protein [Caulobacterales bacterium]|nr:HupE/UreJ family protein [Caulobacterales bacterium]